MSVRHRKDTNKFEACVIQDNKRFRRSFDTHALAARWETDSLQALARGFTPDMGGGKASAPLSPTVQDAFNRAAETRWAGMKDEDGLYHNGMAVVTALNGCSPIKDITRARIDNAVLVFRNVGGHAPGTINRRLSALSAMLQVAKLAGWISDVPSIPWQTEPEGRIREFSDHEVEALMAGLQKHGGAVMMEFASFLLFTACRVGEALQIEGANLRDSDRSIWLPPETTKSAKGRRVFCTVGAWMALQRAWAGAKVVRPQESRPFAFVEQRAFNRAWSRAKEETAMAADAECVPHALRHTAITRMVRNGVAIPIIAKMVGHADIRTTMRYSHANDQDCALAAASMEAV